MLMCARPATLHFYLRLLSIVWKRQKVSLSLRNWKTIILSLFQQIFLDKFSVKVENFRILITLCTVQSRFPSSFLK